MCASQITDVLRCSVCFETLDDLLAGMRKIEKWRYADCRFEADPKFNPAAPGSGSADADDG